MTKSASSLTLVTATLFCIMLIGASPAISQTRNLPGTTYIRADGSVDPATASITKNGNEYFFTWNITGRLTVERDNIVISASNFSIINDGLGSTGIYLTNRIGVTLRNANAAIYLENSSNCTITSNNGPIHLRNSFNNIIANNTIAPPQNKVENGLPVAYDGLTIQDSYNNSIYGNYISANMRSINLSNSTNNNIYENIIAKGGMIGIYLANSENNSVVKNNIVDNTKQVEAWDSYPNTWDDGTYGNYWSDNAANSTYEIKITLLTNLTKIVEYDHKAQLQPYQLGIAYYAVDTLPKDTPTPTPTPGNPSQTPTQSVEPSASPEPTQSSQPNQTTFLTDTLYFALGAALFAVAVAVLVVLRRRRQ